MKHMDKAMLVLSDIKTPDLQVYGTSITGDVDNQADLQAAFDDLFVEYGVSSLKLLKTNQLLRNPFYSGLLHFGQKTCH